LLGKAAARRRRKCRSKAESVPHPGRSAARWLATLRKHCGIHVRRLRAKLGASLPLETLRGSGYKLRAPDAEEKGNRGGTSKDKSE